MGLVEALSDLQTRLLGAVLLRRSVFFNAGCLTLEHERKKRYMLDVFLVDLSLNKFNQHLSRSKSIHYGMWLAHIGLKGAFLDLCFHSSWKLPLVDGHAALCCGGLPFWKSRRMSRDQ